MRIRLYANFRAFNFATQHAYAPMVETVDLYGVLWFYSALTAVGLELKSVIEQMREQVQNVE